MIRRYGILFFLILLIVSAGMFFKRNKKMKAIHEKNILENSFKIFSNNLTVRSYSGVDLLNTTKIKKAFIRNDNIAKFQDRIIIQRNKNGTEQTLESSEAEGYLESSKSARSGMQLSINKIYFDKQIKVKSGNQLILAEKSYFIPFSNNIYSQKPVKIIGPGMQLNGSDGFSLELDKQGVEIYGQIEGFIDGKKI